jgi:hypothetical protein
MRSSIIQKMEKEPLLSCGSLMRRLGGSLALPEFSTSRIFPRAYSTDKKYSADKK